MKSLARLAVLILLAPALLLAQTSTGQTTTGSPTNAKPAYEQAGQNDAQAAAPAKPKVPLAYPPLSEKAKERARQLYEYFAHGQTQLLYASFTPNMKKQSPETKISGIYKQVTEKLGTPTQTLSENFLPGFGSPATIYSRTSAYSKSKEPITVILAVGGDGDLTDFQIPPRRCAMTNIPTTRTAPSCACRSTDPGSFCRAAAPLRQLFCRNRRQPLYRQLHGSEGWTSLRKRWQEEHRLLLLEHPCCRRLRASSSRP